MSGLWLAVVVVLGVVLVALAVVCLIVWLWRDIVH